MKVPIRIISVTLRYNPTYPTNSPIFQFLFVILYVHISKLNPTDVLS